MCDICVCGVCIAAFKHSVSLHAAQVNNNKIFKKRASVTTTLTP